MLLRKTTKAATTTLPHRNCQTSRRTMCDILDTCFVRFCIRLLFLFCPLFPVIIKRKEVMRKWFWNSIVRNKRRYAFSSSRKLLLKKSSQWRKRFFMCAIFSLLNLQMKAFLVRLSNFTLTFQSRFCTSTIFAMTNGLIFPTFVVSFIQMSLVFEIISHT